YVYLEAAYSKGGISYVDSGFPGGYSAGGLSSTNWDSFLGYDAVVGPTGKMTLTPAYSALVSYEHYWTPTIRQAVFGTFAHIDYSGGIRTAAGFAAGAACPTCLGTVTVATAGGPTPYNPFSTQ